MQDAKFFLLAIGLENASQKDLNRLTSQINAIIKSHTKGGVLSDSNTIMLEINEVIDEFYERFVTNLETSAQKVGTLRANDALQIIIPKLTRVGLYKEAVALRKQIANYSMDVKKRLFVDKWAGETLGKRITTLRSGTRKTVDNIIINGMSEGKGSKLIAKELEQYINPLGNKKTRPYDQYRKRFGRAKNYKVKGVPSGSVRYNALRIARTEVAHIYREATTDFYENKWWVKGYSWNLSNRHDVKDICDEYASKEYKTKKDLPTAHPQCLCDIRPVLMEEDEFLARLSGESDFDKAVRVSKRLARV